MNEILLLGIIISFYFLRLIFFRSNKDINSNNKYLLVSFFITTIPFEFVKWFENYNPKVLGGTLLPVFSIPLPILIIFFLFFILYPWNKLSSNFRIQNWIKVTFFLVILSLINPYNEFQKGTFIFSFFFGIHILLFYFFNNVLKKHEIIQGLFDGFLILGLLQLILAICFPALGIISVTNLFHTGAEEWATRLGSRDGAIGVFKHPGNLGLYTLISSSFFLSCYLKNYKQKLSMLLLISNAVTLFLTYSRTTYFVFIIVLFSIYFLYKNAKKNIFTIASFFKFILPTVLLMIWIIYFSPISESVLTKDTAEQYENRMIHWLIGLKIFTVSPLIGVGFNAHLAFLSKNYSFASSLSIDDFFTKNPIHNIHLIILTEVGIIGLVLWITLLISKVNIAKKQIANNNDVIISLTSIGIVVSYFFYGMTGWAPFSPSLLPYFLFIIFFSIQNDRNVKQS